MRVINKFEVPSYSDESRASLTVIAIDNLDLIYKFEDDYENNYVEFKDVVLNFLGEGEEHNVMPGAIFHRYDVSMFNGLILVYCQTMYNV